MHAGKTETNFVNTPYHDTLLADMMESHMVKDFCIIGPRVRQKVVPHSFVVSVKVRIIFFLINERRKIDKTYMKSDFNFEILSNNGK